MTPKQAQAILQFLSRVELRGSEAPALMECVMVLRLLAKEPHDLSADPAPGDS